MNAPHYMMPEPFVVKKIQRETEDTVTLVLTPREGREFPFAPGQFNMVYSFGRGEVPISISGSAEEAGQLVHTIRNVGLVTAALCSVKEGEKVGIRGPFGRGFPIDRARGKDVIVLAGGIGLAPLRPVIYHLLNHRKDYGRFNLLYGARHPDQFLFEKELHQWMASFDVDVEITVDAAPPDWHNNVGVVTQLIPKAHFTPENTVVYICGPEIMMKYSVQELLKEGIGGENIYLSSERNMECAQGFCGHCQYGPHFVCKDGPVFAWKEIENIFAIREI